MWHFVQSGKPPSVNANHANLSPSDSGMQTDPAQCPPEDEEEEEEEEEEKEAYVWL